MKKILAAFIALACSAAAQININVQAKDDTGILFRPAAFWTGNAAAIYSATGFPSQSGNNGKVLGTNGSVMSWVTGGGGGGSGTVTSVDVITANGVSATGGPITGSGSFTFSLGAITPTSVNGATITTTTGTLTLASSKVFTVSNTLTLAGTDGSTLNVGTGGTLGTGAYQPQTVLTGTANQVAVSNGGVGATTLSIPSTFIAPGSVAATTGVSGTTGTFSGVVSTTDSTASTSKDTGALIITNGGLGVEGSIFAGTAVNAGTSASTVGLMGFGAQSTSATLELGDTRSADGNAFIDLHGDTTYTDFALRLRRFGTADGVSHLLHRGTGNLEFITQEAAPILFKTTNATAMTIAANGAISAASTFSATTGTFSSLTATRVPFATTGGLLTDSAGMTFSSGTLTLGTDIISPLAHFGTDGGTAVQLTIKGSGEGLLLVGSATSAAANNSIVVNTAATTYNSGIKLWRGSVEKMAFTAGADGNSYLDYAGSLIGRETTGYATRWTMTTAGALSLSSTLSATQLTSTVATGTAPLVVASTTQVANLNAATAGTATVATTVTAANEASDTTTFILFATDATGNVAPKTNAALTFNSNTATLGVTNVAATQLTFTNLVGTVPVANGGTGITSGTSGGVLGYTASGTLASSAALTANAFVMGAGAGATPTPLALTGLVVGNGASAPTAITSSTVGQIPRVTGANTFALGALDLADTDAVTGLLPAANQAGVVKIAVFSVDGGGSAITSGTVSGTARIPFACTLTGYSITATANSGTITVNIWLKATATSIPTISDNINTSGVTLVTNTAVASASLSDFTDTVYAAGDMARCAYTVTGNATDLTVTLYGTRL